MCPSFLEKLPDHCLELILDKLILDDFDNFITCCKRLYVIGKGVREMRTIRLHEVVKQNRPGKWHLLHNGDTKKSCITPGQRFGSTLTYLDNSIYLFGGATVNWTTFNDLWRFDLKEKCWSRRIPRGTCPPPRASANGILYNDNLIIIGGFELMFSLHAKRHSNWDNLPWMYSFTNNEWNMMAVDTSKITSRNDEDSSHDKFYITPTPVGQSACLMLNDQIILFGGAKALLNQSQGIRRPNTIQPYSLSNQTLSLSISNATVTTIHTFGDISPAKRCGHSAVAVDSNRMLIVGGYLGPNTKGTEDMWMLTCFQSADDMCQCDSHCPASHSDIMWYWTEIFINHPLQPLSQFIKNALIVPGVKNRSSTLVILGGASGEVEDSLFQNQQHVASPIVEQHRIGNKSDEEMMFKTKLRSIKRSNQIIVHSVDLNGLTMPCQTCGRFDTSRKEIRWIAPLGECQDLSSAPNVRQGFSIVVGDSSIYMFGGLMYRSIFTRPIYLLNDLMFRDDETEDRYVKACSDLHELTYRCSAILL